MKKGDRKQRLSDAYDYIRNHYGIHTKRQFAQALGVGEPGLYSAFNGNELYLTDSLFMKIAAAFPIISLDWLKYGDGEMIIEPKEKPTSTDEQIANIIQIYANIIKDVEQLHKELLNEIEQTRATRAELAQACTDLHTIIDDLRDDFQPSQNRPLIAAEKPNVYPSTKKKHS